VAVLLAIALALGSVLTRWLRDLGSPSSRTERRPGDATAIVRAYSRAVSEATDVAQVAEALIRILKDALGIEHVTLFLVDQAAGGYRLRPMPPAGSISAEEHRLTADSAFLGYLREQREPVRHQDVAVKAGIAHMAREDQAWLNTSGAEVYVPVVSGDEIRAVVTVGARPGGYGPHELDLLSTLAYQTAAALRHVQLYTDLKALNAEILALNRELQETNERLQRVDEAKTDFITIASHELRTPLTQVRGYADLLAAMSSQGQPSANEISPLAASLGRAAQRLEELVAAMLDASQIDAQALKLYYTETTLEFVLWLCLERLGPAMRERRHILMLRSVANLPPIQADVQRLTQAFYNIIVNAIKYTPDGGRITISGQETGDGQVEVVIADTGVGIDPRHLDLIFEKFYRAGRTLLHSSGTTKFMGGGPGLGLRIARGVIEAHGGRIWAESPGYDPINLPGSTFHVVLPIRQVKRDTS